MIRNSLYNSYLPEAQKGKKQKEIKEGIYNISTNRRYSYLYANGKWYQTEKENVDKPDPNWQEVFTGSSFDESLTNYANKLGKKKNVDASIFKSGIPSNFKQIEEKGLTATDLGTETKKPITENVLRNPIVYSPSLDSEVYISPEGTIVPLSDLTYGINSIIPSRNTLLVNTPIAVEEQNFQSSTIKPEVVGMSPTIVNNYTYNTENNKWYDKNNEEIKDPVLISELQSEKGKKDIVQELLNTPSVNRRVNYVTPDVITNVPEEDLDTYIDPNKLKITKEYLGNLDKEIEYSPSNRVAARTPKEKKERRGRDFSFEFPDLSDIFTRRTKSKPAELQEYTVDDTYNPNNFSTLDVTNLPVDVYQNVYMPESARDIIQGKYPKLEEPVVDNIPVRIVERQINKTAPGGMGLLPFVSRSRTINNMKNQTRKAQYGGELIDEDFDYTLDVDTNKLVEYIKGGYLPKAQTSLNLNNPPTLGEYLGITYPSADINFNTASASAFKRKEPKDYFGLNNKVNTLKAQPYQYPYTELYKNIPSKPWSEEELIEEGFLQKDDKGKISQGKPIEFNTMDTTPLTGDKQFGTKPNERIQYKDVYNYEFDPRKIYERANQEQYAASFGPFAYNLGQFLSKAKSVPYQVTAMPIVQDSLTPDYTPFIEQEARIRQAVNEQSGLSAAQRLNTLIGAGIATTKGKADTALKYLNRNKELAALARQKGEEQQAKLDTTLYQSRLNQQAAEAVREAHGTKAIEQGSKMMTAHGQLLAKEKQDRKKLESANLLAKDYQWEPVADKFGNIDYKIRHTPSNAFLTIDQYKEHLDSVQKKTKETEDKKAEEKTASTDQSITDKKIQEAKDLERKKLESEPEYLKYQDWLKSQNKKEAKKFGGWIKENQQYKKRRNRLYY